MTQSSNVPYYKFLDQQLPAHPTSHVVTYKVYNPLKKLNKTVDNR